MSDPVGKAVDLHVVPPGGSEDPEPISSFYFVFWGFVLLLALVVGLQYLAWSSQANTRDRLSGHTAKNAPGRLRAKQEGRMPALQSSMDKIVRAHGKNK